MLDLLLVVVGDEGSDAYLLISWITGKDAWLDRWCGGTVADVLPTGSGWGQLTSWFGSLESDQRLADDAQLVVGSCWGLRLRGISVDLLDRMKRRMARLPVWRGRCYCVTDMIWMAAGSGRGKVRPHVCRGDASRWQISDDVSELGAEPLGGTTYAHRG